MKYLAFSLFMLMLCTSISANQISTTVNDTINKFDETGKKTGYWVYYGHMMSISDYAADAKVEEGPYVENRKQGTWKKYYPTGKLKSVINYQRNLPKGPYQLFFENGNMEEVGNWTNSRNTGEFRRYHKNGKISQEFAFNSTGKRDGLQKYYHENGQLELEVAITEGKESGISKRYYPNGDLKEEKSFTNGMLVEGSIKNYEPVKQEVVVEEIAEVPAKVSEVNKTDKTNLQLFNSDGQNTLYNRDRQVSQTGIFKKGRLWNGKWYRYSKDGILNKIEVYKRGKYIGDAVIEDEDLE